MMPQSPPPPSSPGQQPARITVIAGHEALGHPGAFVQQPGGFHEGAQVHLHRGAAQALEALDAGLKQRGGGSVVRRLAFGEHTSRLLAPCGSILRRLGEAIAAFRVTAAAADHPRAPEALLAIANCQIEMKDGRAARATLGELMKVHPNSEAAKAGKERLASLPLK